MALFPAFEKTEKPILPQPTVDITDLVRRLRMSEERQENIRKKMQMIEQNMLATQKKLATETKTLNLSLMETAAKIEDLAEKMSMLIKEIQLSAKKEDLDVVKKYLDYWSPVEFVTLGMVEKIIKEKLEEKGL